MASPTSPPGPTPSSAPTMASSYDEPEWSDEQPDPERRRREPLVWLFFVVAAIVAVVAVATFDDDDTDATFAVGAGPGDTAAVATAVPLPTPQPTPTPVEVAAIVEVRYAVDAIAIEGTVPAPAVRDALVEAAAGLVGPEAVTTELAIDESSSLAGGALIISGEIDSDTDRDPILSAFADLGLVLDDRLIIAGSNSSIAQILEADENLSQVTDFLVAAGLLSELEAESEEGFTLFAPTNDAVLALDTIALDELGDAEELVGILRYHLVSGTITSRDLGVVTALTSLQGESIPVEATEDGFVIGGATVVEADVDATNGVVHKVDAVLLPGTLRTEVALNQIVTLDPILFAPNSAEILDDSFPILDSAVEILLANPAGRVEIQGHTDSDGPAEVNLDLSQRRADAVRDYLVEQGVDPARLNATGYGETALKIDPEDSDDDKALNRRIEFRVD